jgi:hypothetical protein
MDNKNIESVEIYPYIVVYKNLYKNIEKGYNLLKDSTDNADDNFFSKWTKWSEFGEYLNPATEGFSLGDTKYAKVDSLVTQTEKQEDQRQFLLEILDNFHLVTQDYVSRYNVDVNFDNITSTTYGKQFKQWRFSGPSICKYDVLKDNGPKGMAYHSDYIREQQHEPGYKFVITALSYFNDDYEGGEIDFVIGNKMLKYKPQAGDYIVFPSGHPELLTEDGIVYLHGVMPTEKTNKYFSRMYLEKYYEGSPEWFENEEKYGKDVWQEMQEEIKAEFRKEHPQRNTIEGGVRVQ